MNSSTEYSFVPTERPGAPALDAPHVAMLFIDAQKYTAERHSPLATAERRDFDNDYFYTRLDTTVKPNWATLVDVCRAAGVDIVSTIISSQRKDGKDLSRDYKATGFRVYAPRPVDELVDELKPASQNEIVIPKLSSSVFCSTNIDTILRNLSTQTLVIAGLLTVRARLLDRSPRPSHSCRALVCRPGSVRRPRRERCM